MAEEEKTVEKTKQRADDNTVFIGSKPTMSYVLAVITQFSGNATEVNVKARGKSISKAVDVVEIVKNKFAKESKVKDIQIKTDRIKTNEGQEMNVSSINIVLAK